MHSHNTLLANARDMVRDWGHGPDTVLLEPVAALPSHRLGRRGAVAAGGLPVRHQRSAAGQSALDWIVETGATYVMGVPTHAMDVLAQQKARGLAKLGAVSVFYMAGAPIPPSVAAGLRGAGHSRRRTSTA